jgi:hypothetical protein
MTGLAAVLRDQGELSQARRLYEELFRRNPRDAYARLGLDRVLAHMGAQARARPVAKPPRSTEQD